MKVGKKRGEESLESSYMDGIHKTQRKKMNQRCP